MIKVSSLLLAIFLFLPAWAQADGKIRGKYEVIGDISKLKNVNTIEMSEFFNYSCGHCYRFLETSKRLRSKFKDKLLHKKFPIYWGNQTAFPAMAFYIADELGIEEEFTQELFDTSFKLGVDIFQPKVIKFLARDFKRWQKACSLLPLKEKPTTLWNWPRSTRPMKHQRSSLTIS